MCAVLRASQLGFASSNDILDAIRRRLPLGTDELVRLVLERLPQFKVEVK